jgi:hypothetical protein
LVLEEFDWNNEWADSSHVFPQGRRGHVNANANDEYELSWQDVDEATGASSSLRGRNFPRNAHKRARNSSRRGLVQIEEEEEGEEEEEEEEEGNQDPLDDSEVTDCEEGDASNGSNDGGEDIEAAANEVHEFDDGY